LCREFCTEDGAIAMSLSFGPWKSKAADQMLRRQSYFVPGIWPILYHWHDEAYWQCHPLATQPGDFLLVQSTLWTPTVADLPVDAHMITANSVRLHELPRLPHSAPRPGIFHDFDNYLQILPPWEHDLLDGVKFLMSPYAIMDHLQRLDHTVTMLLVSDGGSRRNQTMSFGFTLGTDDGTLFLEHSGPAFGEPTSFRAEGTGQLAGALLLLHLTRYTTMTIPDHWPLKLVCDNAGLIHRLNSRREYAIVYPNATLANGPSFARLPAIIRRLPFTS